MIDLPNTNWVRSTKMPSYAVCLDPQSDFFGYKMVESGDRWVVVSALKPKEVSFALHSVDFENHQQQLRQLQSGMDM